MGGAKKKWRGFYKLQTPHDLLAKLEREYERLNNNTLDSDIAFNFVVTAEHLIDWYLPGSDNKSHRTALRKKEPLLQLVSHLANGAKHFQAEAAHHRSVGQTGVSGLRPMGFRPPNFRPIGFEPGWLAVSLEGDAAHEYGWSITLVQLAENVLKFWREELEVADSIPKCNTGGDKGSRG